MLVQPAAGQRTALPEARVRFLVLILVFMLICPPRALRADPLAPEASAVGAPTANAGRRILLPWIRSRSPGATTGAAYDTIPVPPPRTDRPAAAHADLNLGLRGYVAASAQLSIVDYGGSADPGAPQIPGMFPDNRTPRLTSVHRVRDWNWGCGTNGCAGAPLTTYPVTLLGMATRSGEPLAAPRRPAEIYGGGFVALVLYAEPSRITLKYTREDNVVRGYTVHLEKLRVDADLLEIYRRADAAGRSELPALRNGQALGVASGAEVLVAIRDTGAFLDPRSRKDWWQGRYSSRQIHACESSRV